MNHILVVDDSAVDRKLAGGLLQANTNFGVEYAADGIEALEQMENRLPVAVLADLRMPEMDGLQLVEQIRRRYPMVPVVLMTGHGSEDVAVQALVSGASDYVPKTRLATDLAESIEGVLAVATQDRPHRQLAECLRYNELRYVLTNDPLLIPPLVQQFQSLALDLGLLREPAGMRFARSLMESLRNAVYHGNLELPFDQIKTAKQPPASASELIRQRRAEAPYRDRTVEVHAIFVPEVVQVTIRDEGPGFDVASLPNLETHPEQLVEGSGRGLVLIRTFMDEVRFNEQGNEITLVKRTSAARP